MGKCRDYTDRMTSRLYRVDEEARVHLVKELPNMVIWAMETGKDFLVLWESMKYFHQTMFRVTRQVDGNILLTLI